ncbi:DVL protein [Dioscorea alata]|uniref:DVL protein n=1 Tax=Dioscorea alata TaxID=55571 RepID=A0ACB7VUJ7_DIOAL|nr:DVL protein [Dioscorea alata]
MEMYMDEKWKLSKKGSCRRSSSGRRSVESGAFLKRSASALESRGSSQRSFTSRCASLVKEQRAKFYIMRRCVTMLICWRDYP